MNKASLIDKITEKTGVERRLVLQVLDAFEATVIERLKAGDEVTLTGFGTFIAKFRSARGGVNPQKPAERISVPAVTVPKFRAGKTLKDALKHKAV
ncbi:MAG TPA: HU family DNA-binding protein [Patescibacteria group bacterium]|nr:HU family DNA-binding protein [Patescibacteria group bacterium]